MNRAQTLQSTRMRERRPTESQAAAPSQLRELFTVSSRDRLKPRPAAKAGSSLTVGDLVRWSVGRAEPWGREGIGSQPERPVDQCEHQLSGRPAWLPHCYAKRPGQGRRRRYPPRTDQLIGSSACSSGEADSARSGSKRGRPWVRETTKVGGMNPTRWTHIRKAPV
jgi:hypothetical protein